MIRSTLSSLLRRLSIRQKLMFITMASSMAALLLVAGAFLIFEYYNFRATMQRDLATLAVITGQQSTAAMTFGSKDEAREILERLRAKSGIEAAALYLGTNVFVQYYAGQTNLPPVPAHPGSDGWHFHDGQLTGFQHIEQSGNHVGAIYLRSDLQELHDQLWSHALIIVFFTLVALAAAQLLAIRLQKIISRPIFHLAETARLVSTDKDYALRARKESGDELGQLIDGFNAMLAQIQKHDGALKDTNEELEKRVEERTRDLRVEIAERRRAEAALQEQFSRITLLNQITQAISERQNLENILQVVLRQLEDHFAIAAGLVCLSGTEPSSLRIAAVRQKNSPDGLMLEVPADSLISLPETWLESCARGEMVHLADTAKAAGELAGKLFRAGLTSAVAAPMRVENELFGVLLVARRQPDAFTGGECEFLHALCEHVALATHQAQLHEQLEKAYNELHQTQQAVMQQERLKALGQMASGIAHDINNALSPVVGFADLIVEAESGLSDDSKRHLRYIRTAGEDIAHIVARLREFYRQRDEADSDAVFQLQPNQLVTQVVDMTRPRWRDIPQGHGIMIEVRTELDPNVSEFAGLESEIREALTNLIINAVDAVPKGGIITLRTRAGEEKSGATNDDVSKFVVLEVSDNGTGMDENTRRRCLEPFFSTKGRRGTGLGLAMVYGVLDRHEGRIEIESELGVGTTMRLIFPVRKITSPDTQAGSDKLRPAPCRILCLDDEAPLRELLNDMLKRDGHDVAVADGGQTGLDIFRAAMGEGRPFDAVITDLGMPYVDGREIAAIIKHESPATPVIMLTGWGTFMKDDGALPAHTDGILSKPPRIREIRSMLHRLTRHAGPSRKKSKPKLMSLKA
jgi:signal transduction histidine kinase/ActR/RegA family two-component response regulator